MQSIKNNVCKHCGYNFTSIGAYKAHRVKVKKWSRERDRRCETPEEMQARGLQLVMLPVRMNDKRPPTTQAIGTWISPAMLQKRVEDAKRFSQICCYQDENEARFTA